VTDAVGEASAAVAAPIGLASGADAVDAAGAGVVDPPAGSAAGAPVLGVGVGAVAVAAACSVGGVPPCGLVGGGAVLAVADVVSAPAAGACAAFAWAIRRCSAARAAR
jgi:hypothetical protein